MRRSYGRIIAGAILVVVGVAWLLESADIIDLPARSLLAIALIVVGVGLVAAAPSGGSPGLIVTGIVLVVLLLLGSSRGSVSFSGDPGADVEDRVFRPNDDEDLRPYRIDAGQLVIDLTRIDLDEGTHEVQGRVGAGQILVLVPRGVPIRVEASTGAGNITIFGDRRAGGISADDIYESRDYDDGEEPRISMELRASVGGIRVEARSARR
jgi:hypothetical protein